MKKSIKYLMMAALMTAGFTSCNNNEVIDNELESGVPASFTIKIAQPATYADNHTDDNATAAEVKISTIDVFVFKAGNVLEKHQSLDITGISGTNGVYTLPAKVTTTEGAKDVYVGLNLTSDIKNKIIDEGVEAIHKINTAADLMDTTKGFVMFSTAKAPVTLKASVTTSVEVHVSRLLAKVIVKKATSITEETVGGKIKDLMFEIGNGNTKFYALPKSTFEDPNYGYNATFQNDFYKGTSYVSINDYYNNDDASGIKSARVKYALENTASQNSQGQNTFALIKGSFIPKEFHTGTDFAAEANSASDAETFYTIEANKRYFFKTEEQAKSWITSSKNTFNLENKDIKVYTNGLCYYRVYLNPTGDYNVYRNKIYDVLITKINGIGEPGEEVVTPGDLIKQPINMDVEIHMQAWEISNQSEELG